MVLWMLECIRIGTGIGKAMVKVSFVFLHTFFRTCILSFLEKVAMHYNFYGYVTWVKSSGDNYYAIFYPDIETTNQ